MADPVFWQRRHPSRAWLNLVQVWGTVLTDPKKWSAATRGSGEVIDHCSFKVWTIQSRGKGSAINVEAIGRQAAYVMEFIRKKDQVQIHGEMVSSKLPSGHRWVRIDVKMIGRMWRPDAGLGEKDSVWVSRADYRRLKDAADGVLKPWTVRPELLADALGEQYSLSPEEVAKLRRSVAQEREMDTLEHAKREPVD